MKKRKLTTALLMFILSLSMALAIFVGTSSAEEVTITAGRVTEANVAFNEKLYLAFTVEETILCPKGAELGLAVWESTDAEPSLSNCSYVNFNQKTLNSYYYYKTRAISLSDVGKEIYVAACYKLDGEISLAQKPIKYSVAKFFLKNLASPIGGSRTEI